MRVPVGDASNIVGFGHYYNCSGCEGHSPLFANASNGNTTYPLVAPAVTNILVFDYEIAELGAEFNTQVGSLPLTLWGNYAQNMADGVEEDTAYNAGFRLGRASNPRTWEAAAMYQSIDKDALFGQFIDSDFGNGLTDTEGWALRGGLCAGSEHRRQPDVFHQHAQQGRGHRAGLRPAAARSELEVLTACRRHSGGTLSGRLRGLLRSRLDFQAAHLPL